MTDPSPEHIAALIERIGRLLNTDARARDLLPVQWEALRYLARANRFSRTHAALTAYLGLTKGTVSQTLSTLQARGLVTKQIDSADRRSRRLSLSNRGWNLLSRDPLTEMINAIERLAGPQRNELDRSLQSILSSRLEAQGRQPFGQCRDCRHFAHRHTEGSPHFCQLLNEPLGKQESGEICYEHRPASTPFVAVPSQP